MNFSIFEDICQAIRGKFSNEIIVESFSETIQPYIIIEKENLLQICDFLYKDPRFYFDLLNCITAHDNGPEIGTMEVWYHLTSIPKEQSFIIKLIIDRNPVEGKALPEVPSVSSIWKTADWHEREAYDLLGIEFQNHPDLRRILLPADWEGYPLRKDYVEQEKYHGIKVKY
jgi:NADH-quinone oxidoreductase subunit C